MTELAYIALVISIAGFGISIVNLLRLYDSLSKRVKNLEHFIYPEWEEERRLKVKALTEKLNELQ